LRRALVLSDGDLTPFFTRPISGALAALIIGSVGWKLWTTRRGRSA
jgi:putative tricarboxylic transport membrane protein